MDDFLKYIGYIIGFLAVFYALSYLADFINRRERTSRFNALLGEFVKAFDNDICDSWGTMQCNHDLLVEGKIIPYIFSPDIKYTKFDPHVSSLIRGPLDKFYKSNSVFHSDKNEKDFIIDKTRDVKIKYFLNKRGGYEILFVERMRTIRLVVLLVAARDYHEKYANLRKSFPAMEKIFEDAVNRILSEKPLDNYAYGHKATEIDNRFKYYVSRGKI